MNDATINDILGSMGIQEASPATNNSATNMRMDTAEGTNNKSKSKSFQKVFTNASEIDPEYN